MQVFDWTQYLRHEPGLVVAVAESEEQAREYVMKAYVAHWVNKITDAGERDLNIAEHKAMLCGEYFARVVLSRTPKVSELPMGLFFQPQGSD